MIGDYREWAPYELTYFGQCWVDLSPLSTDTMIDFMILYPYARSYLAAKMKQAQLN